MIFTCPICLKNSNYDEGKNIKLSDTSEYRICPTCYEIIMKLRQNRKSL